MSIDNNYLLSILEQIISNKTLLKVILKSLEDINI